MALGALLALPAWAQDARPKPPPPPPIDINQVQPKPAPPAQPAPGTPQAAPGTPPAQQPTPAVAAADDGAKYQVSRFILEYKTEHAGHPPIDDLLGARVARHRSRQVCRVPRGIPSVTIRIGGRGGLGGTFYRSALNAVAYAIVEELNRRGLIGIFVQLHPEDIDEISGADLRGGQRNDLRMINWTGIVKDVRTIASGERVKVAENDRVNPNDPVLNRIRAQSPVQAGTCSTGTMDDTLPPQPPPGAAWTWPSPRQSRPGGGGRLPRHRASPGHLRPGLQHRHQDHQRWRGVSASSTTSSPGTTMSCGSLLTGGFSGSNSVNVNFDFRWPRTISGSDLRQLRSSDVGFAQGGFSGTTYAAGAGVGTIYQRASCFWTRWGSAGKT
jgi:hypothetical protein